MTRFRITERGSKEIKKKLKLFLTAYWRPYCVLATIARHPSRSWSPAAATAAVNKEFSGVYHREWTIRSVEETLKGYVRKGWIREI